MMPGPLQTPCADIERHAKEIAELAWLVDFMTRHLLNHAQRKNYAAFLWGIKDNVEKCQNMLEKFQKSLPDEEQLAALKERLAQEKEQAA